MKIAQLSLCLLLMISACSFGQIAQATMPVANVYDIDPSFERDEFVDENHGLGGWSNGLAFKLDERWHPPYEESTKRTVVLVDVTPAGSFLHPTIQCSSGSLLQDRSALIALASEKPFMNPLPVPIGTRLHLQITFDNLSESKPATDEWPYEVPHNSRGPLVLRSQYADPTIKLGCGYWMDSEGRPSHFGVSPTIEIEWVQVQVLKHYWYELKQEELFDKEKRPQIGLRALSAKD